MPRAAMLPTADTEKNKGSQTPRASPLMDEDVSEYSVRG
jgi:hypothetical protein